ncbi:hypothetical protein OROGR_023243 [Orobanche gracilis]
MSSEDGSSEPSSSKIARISRKPRYSRFTQQELPACKPILTPGLVIGILISLAIIFIPIGLSSISASENVVEVVERYDDVCVPSNSSGREGRIRFIQDADTNKTCHRTLIVPKKMKHPIFVYYQLDNFYQNHRRYVKSRSDHQLWSPKNERYTKLCEPEATDDDGSPIVPCGLVAWSLFNDTYRFSRNDNPVDINKKNIAWNSDRTKKFGSNVYPKKFQSRGLIGGAKLNESIPAELSRKKLVISTATWIGGKNDFLGRMYMTVGGAGLFFAILFALLFIIKPRAFGGSNLPVLE